jgi:hypothetical protein
MPMEILLHRLALGLVLLSVAGLANAQASDAGRVETERQRDAPRPDQPDLRDNQERLDPLLSSELQRCYAMPDAEKARCIVAAKQKFGEM